MCFCSCCLLTTGSQTFYSSAAGDWVNCGICGEWAHFGCDRRQGLGAFKVWYQACVISSWLLDRYQFGSVAPFMNHVAVLADFWLMS